MDALGATPAAAPSVGPSLVFLTYGVTGMSLVVFAVVFWLTHVVSLRHVTIYKGYTTVERANWCSRVGSTMHAAVICIGIVYSLTQQTWDSSLRPLHSVDLARAFFSWSIAYFLYDLVVVAYWQIPLWKVFTAHHIVAMIPFVIYNFSGSCLADTYLLSIYLLVEICVVPMNVATFLEDLGYAHTHVHMGMSFASYGLWIVARGILPLYALYILWAVMIPSLTLHDTTDWVCAMPAIVCGHVISGFCVGCLIWIITPAFFATLKAKESSSSTQVRVTESTRYGTINPV
ncbi:hypothetical protein, variant [Aphanomyces invadans]|uniref:TLC domain-containing protein n=1 Tax=Aphanomyces invadans TaxID=157072 RepID=A0A024TWX4_9STRA|nr:hypothetical protein, variant [Aphanomyces invadans]ETV98513.1 hypothetical protein, variant [Aphanomyces invadans]|eukprot:XP_008872710.1 hypothetical protein, variant [Aphanomyces invadans]